MTVLKRLPPKPIFRTALGQLYEADCMQVLPTLKANTVNTVFADPPFNLKKKYGKRVSDDLVFRH